VQAVEPEPAVSNVQYQHADYDQALAGSDNGNGDTAVAVAVAPPFVRAGEKVGRNDPCPCGSGKKYKHCHGRLG
jgi:preprotein translocase subunit SecA